MERAPSFEIVKIEPNQIFSPEALGSKDKFWLAREMPTGDPELWLFKYSQSNTGQHWAEKIAAEIAALMDIPHAQVDLATFEGQPGAISRNFVLPDQELFHGNQALAGALTREAYDPEKRFGQSYHTFDNILSALDWALTDDSREKARQLLAAYLVLDALIGNTDRHHENWGILRRPEKAGHLHPQGPWETGLAPTFDHASSLGRELLDDQLPRKCRRSLLLHSDGLGRYVESAPGAIFGQVEDKKGLSPLELVRQCSARFPSLFEPAIGTASSLDLQKIEEVVTAIPADMMTELAREFALKMMTYSLDQLRRLTR